VHTKGQIERERGWVEGSNTRWTEERKRGRTKKSHEEQAMKIQVRRKPSEKQQQEQLIDDETK